ncbi:GTPase IMAP family member 4-like [Alosa alosa]|uniref:GTPase IMAP family member 4-like n=1 Tax=Alosa alosa TaxID=278164 RepID=UPI0020153E7E|nr:GTPase IMAP family member 4-like [Alosa alosa]
MSQAEYHKPHALVSKKTFDHVKRSGQVRDKRLTVVDTPGWWKGYPLIDTAERIKQKLVLSVQHCPPGPHAFILTVETGTFTETNRRSIEEHLGLFGENIWGHTIVVFTKGDSLKDKSIEQHIESQGEALKWVTEKCGNRYCVYDKQTKDQNQVIQLLDQIESVVVNNSGRHFELDETTLKEVEEKRKVAKVRANARREKKEKRREEEKRKRLKGQIQPLSEVRIVMLGWVTCGKSYAKNVILDKKDVRPSRTHQCKKHEGSVGDRHVTVVDTPGWWKYFPAHYTPEWVKTELERSVTFGSKAPHAFLLVVPADVSFLEEQRKGIQENMKMFGEMVWRNTIVLFTWGDTLGNTSIEEHIEGEGEPLRWLVEKCGNRYHVFDNVNGGDGSQVHQLLEKIEEMDASVSSCDGTPKTPETEVTESHRREKEVRKEMVEFLDKEWTRRDNELEEKVRAMWRETRRGDRSMDHIPDFSVQENEVYLDTRGLPIKFPLLSGAPQSEES